MTPHHTTAPVDVRGTCYCGGVRFRVRIPAGGEVQFAVFCHCESCRRAHAAPLYQVVAVRSEYFEVTEGAEHVRDFRRDDGAPVRAFCDRCGSKIMNRFPNWRPGGHELVAWFPALLENDTQHDLPAALKPTRHSFASETVLRGTTLESFLHD